MPVRPPGLTPLSSPALPPHTPCAPAPAAPASRSHTCWSQCVVLWMIGPQHQAGPETYQHATRPLGDTACPLSWPLQAQPRAALLQQPVLQLAAAAPRSAPPLLPIGTSNPRVSSLIGGGSAAVRHGRAPRRSSSGAVRCGAPPACFGGGKGSGTHVRRVPNCIKPRPPNIIRTSKILV